MCSEQVKGIMHIVQIVATLFDSESDLDYDMKVDQSSSIVGWRRKRL